MTDVQQTTDDSKCKHCGRDKAASNAAWQADETDGKLCGVGVVSRFDVATAADDCRAHQLHVVNSRLLRAETLLHSAQMTHLMGGEYQQKLSDEIREFLQESKP